MRFSSRFAGRAKWVLRDYRARGAASYDPARRRARWRQVLPALLSPLHYRSERFARGAIVVLPSFDLGWFGPSGPGRQVMIVIALGVIAITALLVAGAAFLRDQRHRGRRFDDEQLFTTTPIPLSRDEHARYGHESAHHAFSTLRIPRWVQAGSLLAALLITWGVAQRVRPNNGASAAAEEPQPRASAKAAEVGDGSAEDLGLMPDSAAVFAFQARDWVARSGGGCEGQLVVTKGEPSAWSLTARVHDEQGQLIDTARARVSALRVGDVVEFSFPRADCDRIGAWDVRGARRPR